MGLYDLTVYDIIRRNAFNLADKVAFIESQRRCTFKEFKEMVDPVANGLLNAGVQKGDRVAVLAKNSLEYFVLYGAAAKIGAIMLVINWRLSEEEVRFIVKDCSPKLVFADEEYQGTMSQAASGVDSVERYFSMGEAKDDYAGFDSLSQPGEDTEIEVGWDDGYVIIHTAAVAGQPRGALLSHGNIILSNMESLHRMVITEKDVNLNTLPFFHVAGLASAMVVMHAGGANVIMTKFDAGEAIKWIEEEKVTTFFNFAPILQMLLDKLKEDPRDISSLRNISGLDLPENIQKFKEKAPGVCFWSGFGQTETSGTVTSCPFDEMPGSAGKVCTLAKVKLVDDFDNEVEVGQPGEIAVQGPLVFKGYWNREEDNEYTFRNGWHHTGDIGRFDEKGYLWYVKRKAEKELIKPGGENVYPAEVEKVVLEHPSVDEVSVIGVRDLKWGEAIKAVCVLKSGASLTEEELIQFVGGKIARYKKPQYVEFVPSLPKTEDGEIDRDKVKEEYGK
jgi:long-chain acyl-CoA synthetase